MIIKHVIKFEKFYINAECPLKIFMPNKYIMYISNYFRTIMNIIIIYNNNKN